MLSSDSRRNRAGLWAGPAAVVLVGAAMFLWTRGIWPDVFVDFGHEIYVFWQISEGRVLFRDIAHLKGPLSPYLNGLSFRLFGSSLLTLVLTNLALLAVLGVALYALFSRIAGRLAATAVGVTLVTVFAFGQLEDIGSYNFLCPYSHEVTHGVILSVVAVFALSEYHGKRHLGLLAAAGLATGLAALTDGHVFLAALGAVGGGVGLTLWLERPSRPRLLASCGSFFAGLLAPSLVAFALLALALPAREALYGAVGSLRYSLGSGIAFQGLYRWQMGTLDPLASLRALALWSGCYVAVLAPPIALGALLRRRGKTETGSALALAAAVLALLLIFRDRIAWASAFRPLPLAMLLLVGASAWGLPRGPRTLEAAAPRVARLVLALLALGLLAKIFLNARVIDYGFALALPGTLLLVASLVRWIPDFLARHGLNPGFFRGVALAIWAAAIVAHLTTTGRYVAGKNVQVGTGRDAFRADWRGTGANKVLDLLAARARPGDTLAVVPEGAILNYLSRSVNPTPHPVLAPPEVMLYGEETILERFRRHPPDRIVVVHADSSIHGVRFFGRDYGQKIFAWIGENYTPVTLFGAPPLVNDRFGILVLERSASR